MKRIILVLISLILAITNCFGQFKVGDYYRNGDIKGIVFFVNQDEGLCYILKTEMRGRYDHYTIGDEIEWRERAYIEDNANKSGNYWGIPNRRIARLINLNNVAISNTCIQLGYSRLPRECFATGNVSYDGIGQRILPTFYPRLQSDNADDIMGEETALYLLNNKMGILLYGIVNYISGELQEID